MRGAVRPMKARAEVFLARTDTLGATVARETTLQTAAIGALGVG